MERRKVAPVIVAIAHHFLVGSFWENGPGTGVRGCAMPFPNLIFSSRENSHQGGVIIPYYEFISSHKLRVLQPDSRYHVIMNVLLAELYHFENGAVMPIFMHHKDALKGEIYGCTRN